MADDGGESGGEATSAGDGAAESSGEGGAAKVQEYTAPEGVPVKFFDVTTGDIDHGAWGKSTKSLEGKLRTSKADMKKVVTEEFNTARLANRPESADDYALQVPESVKMPEGFEFTFNEKDPSIKAWREMVHELGGNQDMFDQGVSMYINSQLNSMPDYETEVAALGEQGLERAEAVNLWAQANLTEDTYAALESFAVTAKGIEALEEIMEKSGEPAFSPSDFDNTGVSKATLEDLQTKQADPRYWDVNKRDPKFVREVDAGFEKLYSS